LSSVVAVPIAVLSASIIVPLIVIPPVVYDAVIPLTSISWSAVSFGSAIVSDPYDTEMFSDIV